MLENEDMSERGEKEFKDFTAAKLRELSERLSALEIGLAQNTLITSEVAAILTLGKGFFKACNFVGRAVVWTTGLTVAAVMFWNIIVHNIKDFFK